MLQPRFANIALSAYTHVAHESGFDLARRLRPGSQAANSGGRALVCVAAAGALWGQAEEIRG